MLSPRRDGPRLTEALKKRYFPSPEKAGLLETAKSSVTEVTSPVASS